MLRTYCGVLISRTPQRQKRRGAPVARQHRNGEQRRRDQVGGGLGHERQAEGQSGERRVAADGEVDHRHQPQRQQPVVLGAGCLQDAVGQRRAEERRDRLSPAAQPESPRERRHRDVLTSHAANVSRLMNGRRPR